MTSSKVVAWEKPVVRGRNGNPDQIPSARSGHSLTMIGSTGFLFGGVASEIPLGDLHVLHLGKTEATWSKTDVKGPMARWKHSACVVNETQIVVFGGHHSPNLRLNDVWVFDSVTMEWSQPYVPETPGFRSTDDEYHVPSENRAPSARGGHTATPVGNGMWVFGGYGGHGYARRDHDDLHRLDTETWEWSRIEPRGRGPQKRCGHQAVAIDTTLFVWGGWNVSTQFDDIFVLDIPRDDEDQQQPMWSECDRGAMLREPCWNSSSCAVAAVPSWKIFVFGGTNGPLDEEEKGGTLGTLNGELSVLDTGTMVWKTGLVDAAARRDDTVVHSCSARSDATLAFDVKSSRLVLFGGWCKEWLGDLHTLDVASFVGPPYTITGINPTTGPITGGTAVEITGYDFFDSGDRITVRFATIHSFSSKSLYTGARKRNRRHVHKDGEDGRSTRYVNETQINCVTPDFSEHGPGEVRVRIALGLDGFTATSQLFTFYSVAHAKHCLVYGPGVLSGGLSGEETTFYIQARDKDNTNRTTGGDEFTVVVKKMGGAGNGNNELLINGVDVFDNEDGTYEVTYLPPSPGKYSVFVKFLGTHRGVQGRVRGSENLIEFHELAPRSNNLIGGKLVESALEYDFELISDLVDKIEAGLRSPPFNEQFSDVQNTNALIWVKKHLNLLYEKREELEFAMDRIECTLATLDANGVPVDAWRRKLRAQRNKFESCLRVVAPKVAVEISPLLEVQADTTRAEIEEYQRRVQTFLDQKVREGPYTKYDTGFARAKEALEETCSEYQAERSRCKEMVQLAELFDCFEDAKASVDIIDFSGKMLQGFTDLWDCVHSCESYVEEVSGLEWNNVDPKSLGENAKQLLRQIRRSDTIVKRSDVYECLEANIEDFLAACPYVIGLKQPTIKPRHWQELRSITSASRTLTEGRLKLRDVLDLKLHLHAKEINHLIEKATREAGQEETLRVIEKFWRSATFNRHHLSVDKVVLGISGDCAERLQSDQLALQALLVSPFEFSKNEAAIWKTTLDAVDEALGLIGDVQVGWARLFPFFGRNQSVAVELPDETERFSKLDEQIREMFHALAKSKTLLALTTDSMLIPRLNDLLRCLDGGRRSLSDYLLGKRRQFPRFYFLSERTLLEILAATHPQSVGFARHVPDIFLATASFKVIDDGDVPVAMEFSSVVGEESVKFDRAIQLGGRVEEFLQTLFKAQACAIRKRLQSSYTRYPNQLRTQWMHERISKTSINVDPAQVALLVIGMVFVKSVEDAMACGESHALLEYSERHQGDLDDLLLSLRTSLTKGERIRLTSIVCQDTHARDVLKRLLAAAKNETSDTFTWKSQIKWRLSTKQEEDVPTVIVDVCDAVIDYQFEYLGNSPHLVITPVTERCFVAVAFALHTNSGSAIVGPSSGKTSTVIALAAAFGRLCFQFNCASELDYRHAANLLKGLAMSGSWILLEKFDAIATGVASVCITLFEQIRRGWLRHEIGNGSTSVDFDGENIYELWRNRISRRPIALLVPDIQIICETTMMAQGFIQYQILASKLSSLYMLFDDVLSKQPRYDWGLCAIVAILAAAGRAKLLSPEYDEEELLLQIVRDTNRTQLAKVDVEVAEKLLNDIFWCQPPPNKSDNALGDSIVNAIEALQLWLDDELCVKVLQLHELLSLRRCVFVVGSAGAGKTTIWKTLKLAKETKNPAGLVNLELVYPNVFDVAEFYGSYDPTSSEWKDGALTSALKRLDGFYEIGNAHHENWLVLDGEINSSRWAEYLHGVMDDTSQLTLASNERLFLQPTTKLIFEVKDLRMASPSIVSRAGVFYTSDDEGKQWRCVAARWVQSQSDEVLTDENRTSLAAFFETYVASTLDFLHKNASLAVCDVALVEMLLLMLQTTLTPGILAIKARLEAMFAFCCIWSLGAAQIEIDGKDSREAFNFWWRKHFGKHIGMPEEGTVYDYWFEPDRCIFETWHTCHSFGKINDFDSLQTDITEVTVPTIQTASINFWMGYLIKQGRAVSVVGPSDSGKSRLVDLVLNNTKKSTRRINLDYLTTSAMLQRRMQSYLTKYTPNTLGPSEVKGKLLVFVDDMNLVSSNAIGLRPTDEFMRELVEQGRWFDVDASSHVSVVDTQYITCTTSICPRAQRHFSTFSIPSMSGSSMLTIFQTFVDAHFRKLPFPTVVCNLVPDILKATLAVHKDARATFRRSAVGYFNGFNVKHVSRVVQGLLMSRPQCGQFDTPESVVRLWCHEVERTYGDLHLSESKKVCLRRLARSIAKISFSTIDTKNALGEAESTFIGDDLTVECRGIAASSPSKQLCFSHITETASLNEDSYECVQDIEKLRMQLKTTLETYNEGTLPKIEVILSEEIILHTARLARILMQPSGHALLFGGIGGAGRRTATRLAAYLCGQTLSQPTSVRVDDFKIHLKELFVQTGVKRERVLLLLPESQIAADHLLALVSEVLMFGCVSRLFNDNEREGIASMIQATGGSTDGAMETCWPIFVRQIRSNLRIVLTASPFSSTFREGCRKFPALTNFTTIDSYLPWSKATLDFLAEYHVKSCPNLFESSPIGFSDVVQRFSPKCHELAVASRSSMVFAGPKSYIEMLSMFVDRLTDSRNERSRKLCRLEVAIEKVREAARSLETLEHDVQVWQKDADFKEEVSHKLAEQVKKTTAVVERQMSLKEAKSASYFTLQAEFEQIVQASVKEVALAAPAVEELNSALDTLRRDEIGDCAAMITLPPGVDEVFGAVMVLLAGINGTVIVQKNGKVLQNDRCWEACKTSLLSNVNGFIEELTKFKSLIEESRVPHVNFLEVRSFLIDENFTEEAVADKLPLATSLVRWVRSVTTYYDKWLDIEPIRAKMAETEKRLERARNELEKQTILFEKLSGELADLTSEFKKAEAERVASAEQVRRGRLKLELGQRLIDALNASIKEWSSQVESLKSNDEHLAAEVLIASAFVSYCGPLESSLRHDLVFQKWIPLLENSFSPPPSILSILASDHDVFRWKSELATCDAKFVENVAIASWSKRWPLLIDPQKHGIAWVKRQDKQIYFATAGKDNALTVVADAITGGHVLVFEKVIFEDVVIEPILLSLFRNSYVERSKIKYARLLEEVRYNENFQLYAQTTQSRPNIPLELQDEMTVIDFSLTERDLENHLAKRILHATSPHLATRRIETSRHNFQTRQRLHVIQRHILKRLDEEAEPAENRELVDALEELALEQKVLAVDLDDRIRPLENGLDALADRYRPVARRGAALFTLMRDLKCMDSKYVYGINLFVGLFTLGVERALAADKRKVPVLSKFKLLARRATKKLRGFSWKSDLLLKPIFDDASRNPFESFRGVANRYVDDNRVISATEQKVGTPLPPIRRASEAAEGEELRQWRNERMMLSVTQVIYRHIARGTHARDKLTLATLLAFMLAGKGCSRRQDIACLVTRWPTPKELKAMCTDLSSWLPRLVWDELVALSENIRESEDLESLTRVPEEINGNSGAWRKWFEHATPEILLLPGKLNIASDLAKLCIIRIMRPDRLPEAIREFNVAILGKALSHPLHVPEEPLHAIYSESSPSRPIVFIMSANSEDLETRIRNLGRHFDYSAEKGNLITFALGCSAAEKRANVGLDAMSDIGGWVLLQSIHLSPGWLPTLENILESKSGTASINFRCFLTIDTSWGFDILPSRAFYWETLLGECVKVIDDVDPSLDLNVSMQRAWCCFSSEMLESCEPSEEYTRCLVGLCFFHSLLVYRRRFSRLQGWASNYSMSLTTLKACASTIKDVLNDITGIPWDFLRHAIVESHYASIVNSAWEKKVVEAYASTTFGDTLLEADASLASDCFAPDISKTDYTYVENHIATEIPSHSSDALCLDDTAGTHYNLRVAERLIGAISSIVGDEGSGHIHGMDRLLELVESWEREMPRKFSIASLRENSSSAVGTPSAPYADFLLSECEHANVLLRELARSLEMTRKALRGQQDHTSESDEIVEALRKNIIPGTKPSHRNSWISISWPTNKTAMEWFCDLVARMKQLRAWESQFELPASVCFTFFRPRAFLAAIKMFNARILNISLEKMVIETHVTTLFHARFVARPTHGAYLRDLYFLGGCWGNVESHKYTVDNVECAGSLADLSHASGAQLPLVYVKAGVAQEQLRHHHLATYSCPVYLTRSPPSSSIDSFVFAATLYTNKDLLSLWKKRGASVFVEDSISSD